MDVPEKKAEDDPIKDVAEDGEESRIDTVLISRVPALLAEDEEDKDSGVRGLVHSMFVPRSHSVSRISRGKCKS